MTELEKKANISWDKNNTVSIETDNEDAYKAGYIAGYRQRVSELGNKLENIRHYLAYGIPHELINEATDKIWHMI